MANNGGPTLTHALLPGSPAMDMGNNSLANAAGLTTDQRGPGFPRFLDGADPDTTQTVDIGAFEAGPAIEDITNKTTPVNTPLSVTFNIGDASLNPTVTALSANTTLVPNTPANINVTGSGPFRTLNITPSLNQVGTSVITVTVTSGSQSMSDTFTLTVTPVADLEIISKTDTPDPVAAGNNITYTIDFRNNGPNESLDVQVRENIPTNTVFVSATVTNGAGWTVNNESCCTSSIFFYKARVANGETATFTVVLKVLPNTPSGSVITNQVHAGSFDPGFTPDPPPNTNNTATATTDVVTSADLSVVKIASPDPVGAGQNLTYTITVSDSGPSDAQNLSLSDTLPASTTLVSFTVPDGWTRTDLVPVGGAGTVTATAPTLAAGANAVFTLVVKVNAATPLNTVLTNSATATSTTTDPNGNNNTGTATTAVVSQPDLTITKSHAGNFSQGQAGATYTIVVSNSASGPTNGSAVTVTDTVPVGLTPTGPIGAHNGWTCAINEQTLTCTRSDVLTGNSSYPSITLTVNVANPAPLTVTNTATVSGGGEVNTANNTASDPTSINCTTDFSLNNTNPLMISRFRMNGPAGPQDEFVEIFNPSTTAHTVASGNCAGGGYGVFASSGNGTTSNAAPLVCYIPNGTVIPAGGYYLCTGATYSLSNLGRNGGAEGATSISDAPIGCNGLCSPGIPDDAGLALMNVAQGINLTPEGGFLGGVAEAGFILYDKVGFGPYGDGAPSPGYPSLAANFCEGAACLKPVGDAGTGGACSNPTGLYPVFAAPPACYGKAGQYQFLRRQTAFNPALGTVHIDTNNNANNFILVAPNPGTSMGLGITGVTGMTAVLGTAGPQGSTAPADTPSVSLKQNPFDLGAGQLSAPNAERNYALDPTVLDPANNPEGTFALRLRFTNSSASNISGLRFRIDQISTLCGAQTGASTVGSGSARNLSAAPDCGTGSLTAILKLLNSAQEVVMTAPALLMRFSAR